MPEGWDGTIRDLDEVHYEISQKEDEMLYEEFLQRMNFNKMKVSPIFSFSLTWEKKLKISINSLTLALLFSSFLTFIVLAPVLDLHLLRVGLFANNDNIALEGGKA